MKSYSSSSSSEDKKIILPFPIKDRGKNLAERLHALYGMDYLETDPSKIVYTIEYGRTKEIPRYPFAFELIAVPMNAEMIRNDPSGVASEFNGLVNGAHSPLGTKFDGNYSWFRKKSQRHVYADDIVDCLQQCGFVFYSESRSTKNKVPCAILGNLISERVDYTEKSKSKMDASPYVDTIVNAVERVASKVPTYKSIGVHFASESYRYRVISSRARASTTYIKDIVEMMLLPRIKKVKAGGKITIEQTQDSLWYNALPLFEQYYVKYSNDSRQHFKTCIRDLCKEYDIAREQIGIIAAPWASMFFDGQWFDISFDTIEDLAKKGTDIIFIEKRDIVRALGKYASRWGVALVNTHGILSDYAEDLAYLADISGAHITLLTDYDIPGILIASKLKESVPRLGVDERMLRYFNMSHENKMLVIPYSAKVARLTEINLDALVNRDKRFKSKKVIDLEFLKQHKIEIDAILAQVGPESLWEYLRALLKKEFPRRNYLRVIDPRPDLSKHYPPIVTQLRLYYDNVVHEITEPESKKIEEELKDVPGFIDVKEKEKEILNERLGKIVTDNPHLKDVAEAFVALDKEKGYKISEIEIPRTEEEEDEGEQQQEEEEEEEIPDPPPLQYMDDSIRSLIRKTGMSEFLFTKYHYIHEYGSSEIRQKLADLEHNNEWGLGDWNEDEEELENYEDKVEQARTVHIDGLYKEVIRQFKLEHDNRLPWQVEEEEEEEEELEEEQEKEEEDEGEGGGSEN
jgi:hypothetical protein